MNNSRTALAALIVGGSLMGLGAYAMADHDRDDAEVDVASVAIDQQQAVNIALQSVPGEVTGTELESEDGLKLWEIEIVDNGNAHVELLVDANTGEVLGLGEEDDDEDGDGDR